MTPSASDAAAWPAERGPRIALAAGLALALCVAGSLAALAWRTPYLADDWWLIGCFESNGLGDSLATIVGGVDWAAAGRFYRPVWRLGFLLDAALGARPWLSHTINLGLHGACAFGLYRLALRLGLARAAAAWVGLLFLLHPAGFQPATWVASRSDLLGLGFALAGLNALVAGRSRATLVWLALGLLSKESAFCALPIALGLLALGRTAVPVEARARLWQSLLLLGAAVLALRWWRLSDPFGGYAFEPALLSRPLVEQLELWAETALVTLVPWDLGLAARAAAFALLFGGAGVAAARCRAARTPLAVGAGWLLLSLLTLHALGTETYFGPNGRFTYAPAAGLLLMLGGLLEALGGAAAGTLGLALAALFGSASLAVHAAAYDALAELLPRLERARGAVARASGPTALLGLPETCGPLWVDPYFTSFGLGPPFQGRAPEHPITTIRPADFAAGRMELGVFRGLGAPGAEFVPLAAAFDVASPRPETGPELEYDAGLDLLRVHLGPDAAIVRLLAAPDSEPAVARGFGAAGSLRLARPRLVLERPLPGGTTDLGEFTASFGAPGGFRLQAVSFRQGAVAFGPVLELHIEAR